MKTQLPIVIDHRDVGATIATDIYLGQSLIVSYLPGTSHEQTAQEVAEKVLASALRTLLTPELAQERVRVIRSDAPLDFDYQDEGYAADQVPGWTR